MDQQQAFDVILQGHNAFVTGNAGTGKTFLLAHIYNFFKSSKKIFVTCTTGIACKNLPSYLKPTTLHSLAGIKEGRSSSYSLLEQVKRNSDAVERWTNVDLLMIDEVSMLSNKVFDSIEFIARMLGEKTHFTISTYLTLPQVLQLKVGAKVMLVTTLSKELVNGLTGIVTSFSTDNFPMVKFDNVKLQIQYNMYYISFVKSSLI